QEIAGDSGEGGLSRILGLPCYWQELLCFYSPGRLKDWIPVFLAEIGFRRRRNRSTRSTPLNGWIGAASLNRCESLSSFQQIPSRKPTQGGMRSIVSPSG